MLNRQKGERFVSIRWNRVHQSISGLSNRRYQEQINSSWVYWTTLGEGGAGRATALPLLLLARDFINTY